MRCRICQRPDAQKINLELLARAGRHIGVVTSMAERLGVHRETLWRHRKFHLKMNTSRKVTKQAEMGFAERARHLGAEADRLQCMCENGMPKELVDRALKALMLRVKLLEMESRFAGRPADQREAEQVVLDADADRRAEQEYLEVVGE